MVCGTVHMNITQIVIYMTQRDRRFQSTSIALNRRLHKRQSRNRRFVEKNVSPAESRTSKQLRACLLIGCYRVLNVTLIKKH